MLESQLSTEDFGVEEEEGSTDEQLLIQALTLPSLVEEMAALQNLCLNGSSTLLVMKEDEEEG